MYSTPISIYCITETWLSNYVLDCEILPCEYTLYRKDRGSRGGGVLIAVSDSVPTVLISSPEELEIITVNITYHEAVYHEPRLNSSSVAIIFLLEVFSIYTHFYTLQCRLIFFC